MSKYKSKEFLSASESEESGSDAEAANKKKGKKKVEKQRAKDTKKEDSPVAKKSKVEKKSNDDGDGDGVDSWAIGRSRKVTINEFRGKKLVDIREFYEKDGKEMPGRKGISLNVEQWRALVDVADQVDNALNKH